VCIFIKLTTSGRYNDSIQVYAAGAVEAAVSSELIYKHWMKTLMGYCSPFTFESGFCHRLKDYITTNLQWVRQQIEEHPHCPYWHQVFAESVSANVLNHQLLPGNKDLLVSHDAWNIYQAMLRILKKYQFAYRVSPTDSDPIPGGTQAFSSYPGSIFSGDDFYILSTGLVTLETSINNSNPALWKFVQPTGAVMEWLRNIVANRLAASGKEWAEIFSKHNRYNNQWMIVEYRHFTPGMTETKEQLFTVLEQLPGLVPLYEYPFPTPLFFCRYNNFKNDPLSWCEGCDPPANGENTISARSDLNPANGTYPFGALKQKPHGGTDMKVTSYGLWREFGFLAASGPTWDQIPAFQWSSSPYSDLMHIGHPDTWAFAPVNVTWST
uniref:Phospholipase B-like n=1 Tax=Oncorhynchus tshawytscha TaxID=74940 RepID=A0A8C8IU10_ONCTS